MDGRDVSFPTAGEDVSGKVYGSIEREQEASMKLATKTVILVGLIALTVATAGTADAKIIHVVWPKQIQDSIDVALPGDVVFVHIGTYAPSTNGESFPLIMKNGIHLIGEDRDYCSIDAEGTDLVILCSGITDPATSIERLTLCGGDSMSPYRGGAVHCSGSSLLIHDNIVTENRACSQSVISCRDNSSPTILGNVIVDNHPEGGAAVGCYDNSSPVIQSNMIAHNKVKSHTLFAIYCSESAPEIVNNVIYDNRGNGVAGGISCQASSPNIINNLICQNICGSGACSGQDSGACSEVPSGFSGNVILYTGGAGILCSSSSPNIMNNIITGNGPGAGIYCEGASYPVVNYDDVWMNYPLDYSNCGPGTGCISEDPLYIAPYADDFHLEPGSPCIDVGDNYAPALPSEDFDGNPRILDGNCDGVAIVDMGAFERKCGIDLITGGGWIPGDSRSLNDKRSFGFNVHAESEKLRGQLQFNDHETGMKVHSEAVLALVIYSKTQAEFSGRCRVDHTSAYTFECLVEDNGEPGHGGDRFGIEIWDPAGDPYYSAGDLLGGGNIQIHMSDDGSIAQQGMGGNDETSRGSQSIQNHRHRDLDQSRLRATCENYPNPFSSSTTIIYSLPSPHSVTLSIYDLTGKLVRTLVDDHQDAGHRFAEWDGKDQQGITVATGTYIYRLVAGNSSQTGKMIVVR